MGEARRSKKREIKKRGEEKRKREKKKKRELSQQSYGRRVVVIAWRVCVSIGLVTGARSTSRRKRLVCTRMNAGAFGTTRQPLDQRCHSFIETYVKCR